MDCPRFKEFYGKRCEDCSLYHPTKFCNQRRSHYKSPRTDNQGGNNGKGMDKRGKRINAVELQEENNSIVFVEPENNAINATSLSNNLFQKN